MEEWEHRRLGEKTIVYLNRVLGEHLGLSNLASRARRGDYSQSDIQEDSLLRLINDLRKAEMCLPQVPATENKRNLIHAVTDAARQGEFDETDAEFRVRRFNILVNRRIRTA